MALFQSSNSEVGYWVNRVLIGFLQKYRVSAIECGLVTAMIVIAVGFAISLFGIHASMGISRN